MTTVISWGRTGVGEEQEGGKEEEEERTCFQEKLRGEQVEEHEEAVKR
jgi:hypothetical protein